MRGTWFRVCLFVLFGLYVAFNNLSVKSRRCLDVAGSSMLTFRVLPHWNVTPQTLYMISHPVTLYWHWADQFWFLALLSYCWAPNERAASSIFKVFGMTRPGIEPATSRSQSGRSTNWATVRFRVWSRYLCEPCDTLQVFWAWSGLHLIFTESWNIFPTFSHF